MPGIVTNLIVLLMVMSHSIRLCVSSLEGGSLAGLEIKQSYYETEKWVGLEGNL